MKLGEALTLRARQANQLNDLQGRIKASALTQEDVAPPEDPVELIEEYLNLSAVHSNLIANITATNSATLIDDAPIANLLQAREALIRARNIHGIAARAGSPSMDSYRYMRSELKYVSAVDVAGLRRVEAELSAQVTALDARIQQANWETDLIEA
jgi:hypothetical protein